MPTIVFFFKARHGFGHARRTVLIADELRALDPSVEIVLVGQMRSLLPFQATAYPVVNFPYLHRLPNDAMEMAFRDFLNAVIARFEPTLIVEDTFPDPNHLFLPALREVPKVLVMRRLSGVFFERMRQQLDLRHYDRILVAQDRAGFAASGHTPDSLLLAELSARFGFFGPVFHLPSTDEIASVRERYGNTPLVVVAAGAGGDTANQGHTERFFWNMAQVSARFLGRVSPARFVFVTGPYYGGCPPPELANVTTVRYEASLAALLHIAKVAVIRPGFNSMHEVISGPANVIFVPGYNDAEDQWGDAGRLATQEGVDVSGCEDVDVLDALIQGALDAPPRVPPAAVKPAQRAMAAAILEELGKVAGSGVRRRPRLLFLLVGGVDTSQRRNAVSTALPNLPQVGVEVARFSGADRRQPAGSALLLDVAPDVDMTPRTLYERGVRVLFLPAGDDYDDQAGPQLLDWLRCYQLRGQGLLPIRLHHLKALVNRPTALRYRVNRLLDEVSMPAIYLDLSRIVELDRLGSYMEEVAVWLRASGVALCPFHEFIGQQATMQLA